MAACGEVCDNGKQTCTIEATVPTGFESVAAEEAKEMFQTECKSTRGKITFQTPAERVKDILKLGGIDHCRAQVLHVPYFGFTPDGDDCLSRLQLLVKQSNWEEGLSIWSKFYSFNHPISSRPDRIPTDEELIDVCYSAHMPGHKAAGEGKKKNRKDKRKGKKERNERGQNEEEGKMVGDSEDATGSGTSTAAAAAVQGGPAGVKEEDSESGLKVKSEEAAGAGDGPGAERKGSGEAPVSASASVAGTCNETVSDQGQGEQQLVQKLTEHCDSEGAVDATEGGADSENLSKQPLISTAKGKEENHSGSGSSANSPVKTGLPASAGEQVDSTVASPADCPSRNVTEPENPDQSSEDRKTDSRSNSKHEKKPRDPTKPAFRVTCKRAGENHSFDSMSAAASFGSAMQTYFGWQVDMTDYDIEVVLTIDNNEVSVGLALTPESLHKRNLVAFGVTTLRPTICHNMLRMVKVCPGHIVCDPLCGTSSISIQGALNFPAFQLCGDNHNIAMEKTQCNKDALNAKRTANGSGGLMMDAVQWNACHLPLRDGIVDVFVSDLPFGKRVGRRFDNQKLYFNVLDEMARCGKFTGRAALLTGDMNNMMKAIQAQKYWARRRCYSCNIGGIAAAVFLLYRTTLPYLPRSQARATPSRKSDQKQQSLPVSDQNGSAPSTHKQAGLGETAPGQGGVGSPPSNQGGMGESLANEDVSSLNKDGSSDCAGGEGSPEACPSPSSSSQPSPSPRESNQAVGEEEEEEAPLRQEVQQDGATSGEPVAPRELNQAVGEEEEEEVPLRQEVQQDGATSGEPVAPRESNQAVGEEEEEEAPPRQEVQQDGATSSEPVAEGGVPYERGFISEAEKQALCQAVEGDRQLEKDAERLVAKQLSSQDAAGLQYHIHHHHHHHFHHHHHRNCARKHDHPAHGGGHQVSQGHYDHRENLFSHREGYQHHGKRDGRHYRDDYHCTRDGHTYYGSRNSQQYVNRDGHFGNRGGQYSNRGGHFFNRDGRHGNRDGQSYGRGAFSTRGNTGRGGKTWKKSRDGEEKENAPNFSAGDCNQNRAQVGNADENPREQVASRAKEATSEAEGVREALRESTARVSDNVNWAEVSEDTTGKATKSAVASPQSPRGNKEVPVALAEGAHMESGVESVTDAPEAQAKCESGGTDEEGTDAAKGECFSSRAEVTSESP